MNTIAGDGSIAWTPEKVEELRDLYVAAKKAEHETLVYEGHTFLVRYASYLIQYLDNEFKRRAP